MGHGSSRSLSCDDLGGSNGKHMSRRERFKKKLHLHLHRGDKNTRGSGSGSSHPKLSSMEDFAGIALVTIISV